ncbi:hypothetical protein ACFFUZ_42220, partial [Kibdelosporangium philippinense]
MSSGPAAPTGASVNAPATTGGTGSNADAANGPAGLDGLDSGNGTAVSSGPQAAVNGGPNATISGPSTSPPTTSAAGPNAASVAQPSGGAATHAGNNAPAVASAGQNTPADFGPTASQNGLTMGHGGLPGLETTLVGDKLPATETDLGWDDDAATLYSGDEASDVDIKVGVDQDATNQQDDDDAETRTLVGDPAPKGQDSKAGLTSALGVLGQLLGNRPGNKLSSEQTFDIPPVQVYAAKAEYGTESDPDQKDLTPAQQYVRQIRERSSTGTPGPSTAESDVVESDVAIGDPVREELIRTAERLFGKRREEDVDELLRQADEIMLRADFKPPPHFQIDLDPEQAEQLDERNKIRLQVAYRLYQLQQDRNSILSPAQELAVRLRLESSLPRPVFPAGAGPRRQKQVGPDGMSSLSVSGQRSTRSSRSGDDSMSLPVVVEPSSAGGTPGPEGSHAAVTPLFGTEPGSGTPTSAQPSRGSTREPRYALPTGRAASTQPQTSSTSGPVIAARQERNWTPVPRDRTPRQADTTWLHQHYALPSGAAPVNQPLPIAPVPVQAPAPPPIPPQPVQATAPPPPLRPDQRITGEASGQSYRVIYGSDANRRWNARGIFWAMPPGTDVQLPEAAQRELFDILAYPDNRDAKIGAVWDYVNKTWNRKLSGRAIRGLYLLYHSDHETQLRRLVSD